MKYPNRKITVFTSLVLLFSCTKFEPVKVNKVETGSSSQITQSSGTVEGTVLEVGEKGIDQHGFYYSTQSDAVSGNVEKSELGPKNSNSVFTETLTGLEQATTYYYVAYLKNSDGEVHGKIQSFTTLAPSFAEVTTNAVTDITQTSAVGGGNVTFEGGSAVTARGVCWGTTEDPTIDGFKTTDGTGAGSFTSSITGLNCGTTYYLRAYATNSAGTNYGEGVEFTTSDCTAEPPTVTTTEITSISQTSAVSGGNVTDNGGSTITSRGVCWSTETNPTILDSRSNDGNGTGVYTSSITGLSCGTTYYVRAYATNAGGTSYGSQVSFTTSTCTSNPPNVSTSGVTDITETTAQGGGTVLSDGGSAVTAKGVCWSTSQNPTLSDSKTMDGTGTGSYTSAITDITCGTTYYLRAYATNESGTTYGSQVEFTTLDCPTGQPTITTTAISNIFETTANGGGTVTDDGGAAVTVKGVCWSTSQNPTTSNNKTTDGAGTGGFTSAITGLSCGTTYYVRAYATNVNGTAYGSQVYFTTSDCPAVVATVSTVKVSSITETTAQGGGIVSDDGGATVTAKGVVWSKSPSPTTSDNITTDGSGTGSFTSLIDGLSCGITYYVRAYAINSAGTAYGNEESFTTSACTNKPTVTTSPITDIGDNYATGGGQVVSDNGASVTARGVVWGTSSGPTVSGSHSTDGTGTGTFTSSLTGLSSYTTYYVRAYATNSAGTAYGDEISFKTSTVTDYDGNIYRTVVIGTQTWMAENLRATHYPDGSAIPYVSTDAAWQNLSVNAKAYAYFNNNSSNAIPYGALYSWEGAMNGEPSSSSNPSGVQGACPSGWHFPSDAEWMQLEMYLGMSQTDAESSAEDRGSIAGKLKETGTDHWLTPNTGATNSSGFTGIGSGYRRREEGASWFMTKTALFWTATEEASDGAYSRYLHYNITGVSRYADYKDFGFAVRCVKD